MTNEEYSYIEATNGYEAIDKVNERIKEIMKEVYENTKLLLEKNKTALVTMVELLMKRGIISIEEIRAEFKEKKIKLKKWFVRIQLNVGSFFFY